MTTTIDAGRMGGYERAKRLTPERRSEIAKKAIEARWAKAKAQKAKVVKAS